MSIFLLSAGDHAELEGPAPPARGAHAGAPRRPALLRASSSIGAAVWLRGPAQLLLPHAAVLCGQSVRHSGGYAAITRLSDGIPPAYERQVFCHGANVRSPLFTRLMQTRAPQYYQLSRDAGTTDPNWEACFEAAGWGDVLCLAHEEGPGDDALLTWAAFYNLERPPLPEDALGHRRLMAELHHRLRIDVPREEAPLCLVNFNGELAPLTRVQEALMKEVMLGLTNKEIARRLNKSDQTVKRQLTQLMRVAGVRNRTELAARCRVSA